MSLRFSKMSNYCEFLLKKKRAMMNINTMQVLLNASQSTTYIFFFLVSKLIVTEKKLTSEFNGILSAFCILLFLNGVVITYFAMKR